MANKPKKQKLTAGELRDELNPFFEELRQESDRGSVLLGAAFLEDVLRELLRARLVDDKEVVGKVVDHGGALDSFSKKIDMAYLVGLIGPQLHRDLHTVREIRNRFAHYHQTKSLKDQDISQLCLNLAPELAERLYPDPQHPRRKEPGSRLGFFLSCTLVVLQQHEQVFSRLPKGPDLTGGFVV